ncbi:MAG: hypothetical protein ACOYIP_04420 [Coriobacteriales bacterium]
MKKKILGVLVLCAALAAFALCACSSGGGSTDAPADEATEAAAEATGNAAEIPEFATVGEALALEANNSAYSYNEKNFAYAFETEDGLQVRVTADMTDDVYKACEAVSFEDEDRDAKVREILSPLPVKSVEDLTQSIIPQEELDAYVGKTGQDLLDAGFTAGSYYLLGDNPEFGFENGYHEYAVVFNEAIPEGEEIDDVDATVGPMTIKSIKCAGISYAASDAEQVEG